MTMTGKLTYNLRVLPATVPKAVKRNKVISYSIEIPK